MRSTNSARATGRRRFIKGMAAGGTALALGAATTRSVGQSATTLRIVSVWEKGLIWNRPLFEFIKRVQAKAGGSLKLEFVGGPEAVSPFQSADSVVKGIFNLVHTSPTFFAASVPEANALYLAEDVPLRRLYDSGVIKAFDELFLEKMKVALVGIPAGGVGATYISRESPATLKYFEGRRIRTTPLFTPMLKALGASTVTIAPAEVYSALERGVVDAVGWPLIGIVERKFQEIAKSFLLPTFYDIRLCMLANPASWNRLDPTLRTLMVDTMREVGNWGYQLFREESAKEQAELQKAGMQKAVLSQTEARQYLRIANDAMWDAITKDSPKHGARLKEMFAKVTA